MIKFFRKIRYDLMGKNKTGKYFKYAIGEILLVVIGILIALSINNWNESRKQNIQEIKILKQLETDLTDNLEEITQIHNEVKLRLSSSDSIMVYFKEKRTLNDSLLKYFAEIRNTSFFNSANTAYEFIQSEGMNLISKDSLRARLTMMYEREFRNIDGRAFAEEQIQNNVLEPFIRKNFKPIGWDTKETRYVKALIQPVSIDALYSNFEFQNILLEHNAYLRIRNRWLGETRIKLKDLIFEVQSEIK